MVHASARWPLQERCIWPLSRLPSEHGPLDADIRERRDEPIWTPEYECRTSPMARPHRFPKVLTMLCVVAASAATLLGCRPAPAAPTEPDILSARSSFTIRYGQAAKGWVRFSPGLKARELILQYSQDGLQITTFFRRGLEQPKSRAFSVTYDPVPRDRVPEWLKLNSTGQEWKESGSDSWTRGDGQVDARYSLDRQTLFFDAQSASDNPDDSGSLYHSLGKLVSTEKGDDGVTTYVFRDASLNSAARDTRTRGTIVYAVDYGSAAPTLVPVKLGLWSGDSLDTADPKQHTSQDKYRYFKLSGSFSGAWFLSLRSEDIDIFNRHSEQFGF